MAFGRGLRPDEDAFGMAATQSCGLMSAMYESMVKRMQHGFASRNGLTAAALAASGYVGIKAYSAMGLPHAAIDAALELRAKADVSQIQRIDIDMGEAAYQRRHPRQVRQADPPRRLRRPPGRHRKSHPRHRHPLRHR
ncbi:MAG: MmgE/PrpD family protein [Trebonia sp.]